MKKQIFTVAILMFGMSTLFASSSFEGGKKGKKRQSIEVVKEIKESSFVTKYLSDSQKLKVEISGNLDPNASVSITNQRGSSILFSMVEKKQEELIFDLSNLEKGTYNIMFITNLEIRIKKVVIN